MIYSNPQLISALSAEYVLGTLRGKARDRFETLKFQNENIQQEISYWESHLNQMSMHLSPVTPREYVLENIRQRLGFAEVQSNQSGSPDSASNVIPIQSTELPTKSDKGQLFKWWSGLATAAVLVLAVVVSTKLDVPSAQNVESIAVVSDQNSKTLWSIDVLTNELRVKVTALVPRMPNNDYQLWIVPASGEAPISIGVLQQTGEFYLAKPSVFDGIEIAALAISKEPKGGSPTGAPTEVLYASELAYL